MAQDRPARFRGRSDHAHRRTIGQHRPEVALGPVYDDGDRSLGQTRPDRGREVRPGGTRRQLARFAVGQRDGYRARAGSRIGSWHPANDRDRVSAPGSLKMYAE